MGTRVHVLRRRKGKESISWKVVQERKEEARRKPGQGVEDRVEKHLGVRVPGNTLKGRGYTY